MSAKFVNVASELTGLHGVEHNLYWGFENDQYFYLQPVYSYWKFGECEAPKLLSKEMPQKTLHLPWTEYLPPFRKVWFGFVVRLAGTNTTHYIPSYRLLRWLTTVSLRHNCARWEILSCACNTLRHRRKSWKHLWDLPCRNRSWRTIMNGRSLEAVSERYR